MPAARMPYRRRTAALLTAALASASCALAATDATAASVATWDRVAQCESSGNWSLNTGNGHYGGLQFSYSTWLAYGGAQYAPRADLATKQQQILIAEKTLRAAGPGQWDCASTAGLTNDGIDPYPSTPPPTAPVYSGDVPVAGKWSGTAATIGVFRDGVWALRNSNSAGSADAVAGFGQAGDVPITGDWDGVGHDQLGVYRPSTREFVLRHDDASSNSLVFGNAGDVPVPGMWDHNGHAQMAVYRPSTATFTVRHDDGTTTSASLGNPGDTPVVGDWDGVGHTQMGVFRPGVNPGDANTFALRHDDGTVTTATYGEKGDLPVVGDWSAKGRTTFGVYRPGTATFALSNAYASGADYVFKFGNGGTWS
ncbi:transglycosylase family protein [Kitasatospora cineracea]